MSAAMDLPCEAPSYDSVVVLWVLTVTVAVIIYRMLVSVTKAVLKQLT